MKKKKKQTNKKNNNDLLPLRGLTSHQSVKIFCWWLLFLSAPETLFANQAS